MLKIYCTRKLNNISYTEIINGIEENEEVIKQLHGCLRYLRTKKNDFI